jgi:hypothetical protein
MLLIVVSSACENKNSDKRSCIYCGITISDNKEIAIKLNEVEDPFKIKHKTDNHRNILDNLKGELCSMKCYYNFKNTFYKQNRDSISSDELSIKVWILNVKRN